MNKAFEIEQNPGKKITIDELIARREAEFAAKKAEEEWAKLIPLKMKSNEPFGILHFGDPHLDDDGCDIGLVKAHSDLVIATPNLYAANVGDTTNNWIGRLAHLYAEQGTSRSEALKLNDWFVRRLQGKWLYVVGGNHDLWGGNGSLLNWIHDQIDALYQESGVRIALRFPNKLEIRINCRHDFSGSSIYNPVHGPMKALVWGTRDHLAIAGHLHISGLGILKDPQEGIAMQAVRVGSYKTFDRYAKEKGFRDQMLGPSCLTVIDPRLPSNHPDLIKVFWDPFRGADYLKMLLK